ncbi:MAG: cadherin repeat domain-containing protein, partial [Acidimicrobiia bacterium]|nr:cadherin repeat domain-containing protein [Acidimicrobiia bacterium]NDE52320.1 cadherin repeat domain-containing protein [Actinomycetota bacterium]
MSRLASTRQLSARVLVTYLAVLVLGTLMWVALEANTSPQEARSAGAPVFTSSSTASRAENAAITDVAIDVNTNAEAEAGGAEVNYQILSFAPWTTNGPDHASFTIDADDGELKWAISPNFESPSDVGGAGGLAGSNTYLVYVRATDTTGGDGATNEQLITITVTNVNEAPSISTGGAQSIAENNAANAVV